MEGTVIWEGLIVAAALTGAAVYLVRRALRTARRINAPPAADPSCSLGCDGCSLADAAQPSDCAEER